jgi:hypothetical protein
MDEFGLQILDGRLCLLKKPLNLFTRFHLLGQSLAAASLLLATPSSWLLWMTATRTSPSRTNRRGK